MHARITEQYKPALFHASGFRLSLPAPTEELNHPLCWKGKRTTLVLRRLPRYFSQEALLRKLDAEGFAACYDFVYLPVDFATGRFFAREVSEQRCYG